MHSKAALSALALAIHGATAQFEAWAFGNMFTVGPASGNRNWIAKATWSLTPPPPPTDSTAPCGDNMFVSIWIGISPTASSGTLVQPLLNWSVNQKSQGCDAADDEWCVDASTFTVDTTEDKKASQKVWINGELVSSQTDTMDGYPAYLYSSNECYKDQCGSINAYFWDNVTITLNEADESFGKNVQLSGSSGSFSTSDDGKTWTGTFKIDADHFPAP
ncbi:hypothetical protein KVR01_008780 [Diaporthe batatas]|uniref:uncharacterized protein n=1 Tax=Diaporthe batatas TaxID=748121 RepID=UPI001D050E06|nr:uncharacterized protein KVR01_008780 [Diaporthe batatas]KAG8161793.1 hypothetical protein KVR01_008780 [Diaporthe batatas]